MSVDLNSNQEKIIRRTVVRLKSDYFSLSSEYGFNYLKRSVRISDKLFVVEHIDSFNSEDCDNHFAGVINSSIPGLSSIADENRQFHVGWSCDYDIVDEAGKAYGGIFVNRHYLYLYEINELIEVVVDDCRLSFGQLVKLVYFFLRKYANNVNHKLFKIEDICFVGKSTGKLFQTLDFKASLTDVDDKALLLMKSVIIKDGYFINFYDVNRHKIKLKVFLYDIDLLSNNASVAGIVKSLGWDISIPNKTIFNISGFQSILSLYWFLTFRVFCFNEFGIKARFGTVSKLSELAFRYYSSKYYETHNINGCLSSGSSAAYMDYLGYGSLKKTTSYKDKQNRVKYKTKTRISLSKNVLDCKSSYFGGRNETYKQGYNESQKVFDYDIKNAYPMAMLTLQDVDWDNYGPVVDVEQLSFNSVGFVELKFKFLDSCMYPSFPVKSGDSIIFPKKGKTFVTLPEFFVAYKSNLLESYEIVNSMVFKNKKGMLLPAFVKSLIEKRESYDKGTLENNLYKLLANGLYGKFTQGISFQPSPEKHYSKYSSELEYLENCRYPSRIYSPAIASYITGFTRALIAEYLDFFSKKGIDVINVTTDGFMITDRLDDNALVSVGALTSKVSLVRQKLIGDNNVIALKHEGVGYTSLKTRSYYMHKPMSDSDSDYNKLLIARGGLSTKGCRNNKETIEFLHSVYQEASDNYKISQCHQNGIRYFVTEEVNPTLFYNDFEASYNMDYDLKRKPIYESALSVDVGSGISRVSFDTEPWRDISEYEKYRNFYKNFNKETSLNNKIITHDGLMAFKGYCEFHRIADFQVAKSKSLERYIIEKLAVGCFAYGIKSHKKVARLLGANIDHIRRLFRSVTFREFSTGKRSVKMITGDNRLALKVFYEVLDKSLCDDELKKHLKDFCLLQAQLDDNSSEVACDDNIFDLLDQDLLTI